MRVGQAGSPRRVGGGAERVSAHVAHRDRLAGGSGRGRCGRSFDVVCADCAGEPPPDLIGGAEFTAGEDACTFDELSRAVIKGTFVLEQVEHMLRAISGPSSDMMSVRFA